MVETDLTDSSQKIYRRCRFIQGGSSGNSRSMKMKISQETEQAGKVFAAAANSHYEAGRLCQAINELEQCDKLWKRRYHKLTLDHGQQQNDGDGHHQCQDEEIIMVEDDIRSQNRQTKISEPTRAELIALPALARRADLAMCHFCFVIAADVQGESLSLPKAETTNNQKPSSTERSDSWEKALESNWIYLQALKGAATSFVQTCNEELQSQQQRQRQPQVTHHAKNCKAIRRAMKSTSKALLMAGVAASHLYLHDAENSTLNDDSYTNNDAWSVLIEVAVLASHLMRIRKEWMQRTRGDHDACFGLLSGSKSSLLENSLFILNETLCNNSLTHGELGVKDEQSNVAMDTFRSALKVAALAYGKLVLPRFPENTTPEKDLQKNKHASKRRKSTKCDASTEDVWNLIYAHSSPLLRSCDQLVDALSFHMAAGRYPENRQLLVEKREICFNEAVSWGNQAGALYGCKLMKNEGCAGYAWRVRSCLLGMNIASVSHTNSVAKVTQEGILQSLEMLASSSSPQYACDLLGCIHAQRGEFSRAIEKFQLSMEQVEKNSPGTGEEINLAERRTIGNIANCFLSMGEVDAPLELLLHLWLKISEPKPHNPKNSRALILSPVNDEMECVANSNLQVDCSLRIQLLWKLFHVSSLAQDWGTCLSAVEELLNQKNQHQKQTDLAHAFALLQCYRPSAIREILHPVNVLTTQPLLITKELYCADALLNEKTSGSVGDSFTPLIYTQHALDVLHSLSRKKETQKLSLFQELQVTANNDHGIALIIAGDSVGALQYFREAVKHSSYIKTDADITSSRLLLPTCFNFALLLLRDGHTEDSVKSWLHVRGHLHTWQKAVAGDDGAHKKLKDLRVMANNRHGFLMAKRSMVAGALTSGPENVMEWVPPVVEPDNGNENLNHVGGVEVSQITALDVVLLQCAISHAKKKASSSFCKRANPL